MGKSFILSDNQIGFLVEQFISESTSVTYRIFDTPKPWVPREKNKISRYYFNSIKIDPNDELDDRTKIINFDHRGRVYSFDRKDVNFGKDNYGRETAYVTDKVFMDKYGTPSEKEELSKVKPGEDSINETYKNAVFEALRHLFSEDKKYWDDKSGRGPSMRGGVVNLHTVGEMLKEIGIKQDGGEWSILNYFDTNPRVRKEIIQKYLIDNRLKQVENLDSLENWIVDNRRELFGKGELLSKYVEINKQSFLNGVKNEKKAYDFVSNEISKDSNMSISNIFLPGSPEDRRGTDFFTLKNGKIFESYQAKPLQFYRVIQQGSKQYYVVKSYNVNNLKNLNVNNFIFASHNSKSGVVVFENIKGRFSIKTDVESKNDKMQLIYFEYPPKIYDPNFN